MSQPHNYSIPSGHARLRTTLAMLLNAGTLLALVLGIIGLGWAMLNSELMDPRSLRVFVAGSPSAISDVAKSSGIDAQAIMLASALVLMATPILRVLASLVLFASERDWLYVGICVVVLGGLALGAIGVVH